MTGIVLELYILTAASKIESFDDVSAGRAFKRGRYDGSTYRYDHRFIDLPRYLLSLQSITYLVKGIL